jgi:excisionase family DNA binding protein
MRNDDIQPLTVTVEQAAKLLCIGRSTAYELVHTGDIPSLRLGRRIVIPTARLALMLWDTTAGTNQPGLQRSPTGSVPPSPQPTSSARDYTPTAQESMLVVGIERGSNPGIDDCP